MTRVLIDENLPPDLLLVFQSAEIEAIHVYHAGLKATSDLEVWRECIQQGAAIVTKDSDFVELASLRNEGQVVLFSVGNMRIREVTRFAADRRDEIKDFLQSSERVLVLRP